MPQENKVQPVKISGGALGITSLVTGIIAFLCGWLPFLSLPLGAVAIVFGALGLKKSESRGLSIAGLVTGIVGFLFGLVIVIIAIAATMAAAPSAPIRYY